MSCAIGICCLCCMSSSLATTFFSPIIFKGSGGAIARPLLYDMFFADIKAGNIGSTTVKIDKPGVSASFKVNRDYQKYAFGFWSCMIILCVFGFIFSLSCLSNSKNACVKTAVLK